VDSAAGDEGTSNGGADSLQADRTLTTAVVALCTQAPAYAIAIAHIELLLCIFNAWSLRARGSSRASWA